MLRGKGITFIAHLYLHFVCSVLRDPIKYE